MYAQDQQYPYFRYAERIDYKSILMTQIQYIHQGFQIGNTSMVQNGILSFEILLQPYLLAADDVSKNAFQEINELKERVGEEIVQLEKVQPYLRTYERNGIQDPQVTIAQKRFEFEQQKYRILLQYAKNKDLLIEEVEEEEA
jgi:hypothetical protein